MEIILTDEGIVFCDGVMCDPLKMYGCSQECGNCPIISMAEEYETIKYDCFPI